MIAKLDVGESPDVATVITELSSAEFSARDAVWLPVMAIATSVIVTVTVIVSSADPATPSVTDRTTTQPFASLPAPHPRFSKFGAAAKDKAPVLETIENKS